MAKQMSQRARRRRQAQLQLIAGVAFVAVALVVLLILLSNRPNNTPVVDSDYSMYQQYIDTSSDGASIVIGSPDAPVVLTEFSDFTCGHCRNLSEIVHQLIDKYVASGDLRVEFKPASFLHPNSKAAASAFFCAAEQGMGWEMHDNMWALYESSGIGAYTQAVLVRQAEAIGLDKGEFNRCMTSAATEALVQSVELERTQLGINGTPAVYINGQEAVYRGDDYAFNDFSTYIDAFLDN